MIFKKPKTLIALSWFFASLLFVSFSAQAQDEINKIRKLIESQNIEKALEEIKVIQVGKAKLAPEVQLLFGELYLILEQPAKASEYFEKTLFSSTQLDDHANAGMAEANLALGNLARAEELADKSLKQNPDLLKAKLVKANILFEHGRILEARKLFKSAMRASQSSTLAGRKFARALMRQGALKEAEEVLKDTLIDNASDAPTLEVYSELLFLDGRYKDSIDYRIDAEEKYRLAGNIIKADNMLAWLNVRGKPKLKSIEKPKKIEKIPVQEPATPVSLPILKVTPDAEPEAAGPRRKAFPPLPKPEPIMFDDEKPVLMGSGVVLNDGLWVLTNRHVAEEMEYASVRNGLGETREVEEIVLSEDDDLAILILNKPYPEDYSLDIEDLKSVNTGEDVFVIGYPAAGLFGTFHPSITSGIISNPRGFGGKEGEFQMTAKINPGNSGGPIFNKYGEIVGLATGGLSKKVMEEESLNNTFYGVTAIRALNFINRPIQVSMKPRFEYSSAELYKYMRSGVVFVVGQ